MDAADIALVLALDGSASVGFDEFTMIVEGCAAALRDRDVATGLIEGPRGGSLICVLLWSGRTQQEVVIPWRRVGTTSDIDAFAATMAGLPRSVRPGTTAIGSALMACEALLTAAPAPARRRIIDVAGDGRSNDGPPPTPVRDRLVAAGVTLNGLCVLHEEPDLIQSYLMEVVGGPDGFALQCANYAGFAEAMRRKLIRETQFSSADANRAES